MDYKLRSHADPSHLDHLILLVLSNGRPLRLRDAGHTRTGALTTIPRCCFAMPKPNVQVDRARLSCRTLLPCTRGTAIDGDQTKLKSDDTAVHG